MLAAGSEIIVREVWDGLLWAARPATVVADDGDELVHWCPAGALGCFATSRFFPGREQLPRQERQLVSLESRRWHYRGVPARGTSLTFVRSRSWASIAATWYPNGQFAHWYVNFQLPPHRWAGGYDTLDLVLDIIVAPDGSWAWKDTEAFDLAIGRGIFDASIEHKIQIEAASITAAIAARTGPFSSKWTDWRAPDEWSPPQLPDGFADGVASPPGATITLSPRPSS